MVSIGKDWKTKNHFFSFFFCFLEDRNIRHHKSLCFKLYACIKFGSEYIRGQLLVSRFLLPLFVVLGLESEYQAQWQAPILSRHPTFLTKINVMIKPHMIIISFKHFEAQKNWKIPSLYLTSICQPPSVDTFWFCIYHKEPSILAFYHIHFTRAVNLI